MNNELIVEIFNAALSAVDPYESVRKALRFEREQFFAAGGVYTLDSIDRIIVIGAGKAAAPMAAGVEELLGNFIDEAAVIAPYGQNGRPRNIQLLEASHPLPDEAGVHGTKKLLELARNADEKTLVICLLSGGGSALLVAPAVGISLEDKQKTTDLLLKCGATINELNIVRKHLSLIKGGRLAHTVFPASLLTLILSDVVGDRIEVIGSGPTAADSSTFAEAGWIIEKYRLKHVVPASVVRYIERGIAGAEPETVKSGDPCFRRTRNVIVAGIAQALFAARYKAKVLGYNADIVTAEIQGQARETGRVLAQTAIKIREEMKPGDRRCLLFGGETTVTVRGKGKGGRNQELSLAFAREISGVPGICLLSASTDGQDGPTDAAGAAVDGFTVRAARQCGISPEAYLENNDSYTFFRKIDLVSNQKHLFTTGPTGTNVMDLQIILLEG